MERLTVVGSEASAAGSEPVEIRARVLRLALAGLQGLELTTPEKMAVCSYLHREAAAEHPAKKLVVVQATVVGSVICSTEMVMVETQAPRLVSRTVVEMVKRCSAQSWAKFAALMEEAKREEAHGPETGAS